MKHFGVIGAMVWDTIYGRDPAQHAVEEWGGIAYALAALDVALEPGWEIVPLIKVGRDLAPRAAEFLGSLHRTASGARFLEVPQANNRVTLRYVDAHRRCEQMSGGVPPWTWAELGPLVRDLDALYVNFISGFELDLATAHLLRHGFGGLVYADLHSLLLGILADGTRVPQPLPNASAWWACFDVVQMNEEELAQLGDEPLAVAASVLAQGCKAVCLTRGPAGAVYFRGQPPRATHLPAEPVGGPTIDPTGCGDVFGAVAAAALAQGFGFDEAFRRANRLAARNAGLRGASGLRDHLLGRLTRA